MTAGVALDTEGNLYVVDAKNFRIKFLPDGTAAMG